MPHPATITVLGDGGWGTTLAIYAHRLGHRVIWWSPFAEYAGVLRRRRDNIKFLPGIRIPRAIRITASLPEAVGPSSLVVLAIPSQYLRGVVRQLASIDLRRQRLLSVAKGIESQTLKRISEVIRDELGHPRLAVLSGPNIAMEIVQGQPASSVVASESLELARDVQQLLISDRLRLYTSTDVIGVELGGALKNPIAIAAGMSDGLGFGSNTKAALITRGVVEMARLGAALGAQAQTFWGLSGLGDLVTTCMAGRNHWLGEQLGQGRSLRAVLSSTPMVIEGVETARAAVELARRQRVELPIIEQVHAVLFRRRPPRQALRALMLRSAKPES